MHRTLFRTAAIISIAVTIGCSKDAAGPVLPTDPEAAQLIYDDIARFWIAFDKINSSADTLPLRVDYLDKGTVGLRDFTEARWRNARTLTSMVWALREYYRSIRENTLALAATEPPIRAAFRELARIYPQAVFPNVYFTIGGLNTGGTTSRNGLLIGAEMYSRHPASPLNELTVWQRSVIRAQDILPAIVVHELIHYQQRYPTTSRTLLRSAIEEGSADFLSELLTGDTISNHLETFAAGREAEIWEQFEAAMNGTDVSRWLYNGGSATTEWPADLGYWVGAQITRAYYEQAANKSDAVREILNIRDFNAFLIQSKYADQFE